MHVALNGEWNLVSVCQTPHYARREVHVLRHRYSRWTSGRRVRGSSRIRKTSRPSAPPNSATWPDCKRSSKKRNCKIIGLSVDPVADHAKWAADIERAQGHKVTYPMIGDSELKIAKLYGMLPAGPLQTTPRLYRIHDRSGHEDQVDADLSDDHRPQLQRSAPCARLHATHDETRGCNTGETGSLATT